MSAERPVSCINIHSTNLHTLDTYKYMYHIPLKFILYSCSIWCILHTNVYTNVRRVCHVSSKNLVRKNESIQPRMHAILIAYRHDDPYRIFALIICGKGCRGAEFLEDIQYTHCIHYKHQPGSCIYYSFKKHGMQRYSN